MPVFIQSSFLESQPFCLLCWRHYYITAVISMQKTNEKFSDTLAAVCMGCSKFVIRESFKGPLIRKIFISVNEAVPWVKTNDDTKSCYTYVQIGKNLQLLVAVLPRVSHFHDDVTRGRVRRVNVLQMRIAAILVLYSGSEVPCLNVGLLRRQGKWSQSTGFEWLARRNGHRRRVRGTARTVQASVCQTYSRDLISVIF